MRLKPSKPSIFNFVPNFGRDKRWCRLTPFYTREQNDFLMNVSVPSVHAVRDVCERKNLYEPEYTNLEIKKDGLYF